VILWQRGNCWKFKEGRLRHLKKSIFRKFSKLTNLLRVEKNKVEKVDWPQGKNSTAIKIRAGPIPILSIGYRPILQAFRYVPIPKNFQILLSEKYLNLIEQAASRKAPTLVFQENWLDNNLLTCYTYSGVFSGVWNLDACWLILIL
jgi:hypothetical protein